MTKEDEKLVKNTIDDIKVIQPVEKVFYKAHQYVDTSPLPYGCDMII